VVLAVLSPAGVGAVAGLVVAVLGNRGLGAAALCAFAALGLLVLNVRGLLARPGAARRQPGDPPR